MVGKCSTYFISEQLGKENSHCLIWKQVRMPAFPEQPCNDMKNKIHTMVKNHLFTSLLLLSTNNAFLLLEVPGGCILPVSSCHTTWSHNFLVLEKLIPTSVFYNHAHPPISFLVGNTLTNSPYNIAPLQECLCFSHNCFPICVS
jgi:hypothetical protein